MRDAISSATADAARDPTIATAGASNASSRPMHHSLAGQSGMASSALQNFFLHRYAEAYRRELDHFVQILRGDVTPAVGYHDGVAALALAEAAQASARSGKAVAL